MWRLWGKEGDRALAAAVVVVAGLAILVSTAGGPAPVAHAQLGGVIEQSMIVVVDRGNDRLQAFYPDGTFAFKFGAGHGQARSIAVGPDGRIVVSGSEYGYAPVEVYHPDGSYAFRLAEDGTSIGRVRYGQVAVGPDGRFVVLDHGGSRIQVFNSDGSFASSFGWDVRGIAYAQHDTDVAVGPDGRIVVADPRYECGYDGQHPTPPLIRIFHPNGTPALSFSPAPQSGYSDCPVVWNVDVGPNGSIVAEVGRYGGAIQVYRPLANGSFVFAGEVNEIASGTGLAVGANGRIVVGNQNNTISVYHPNGSLALAFGSYGRVGGGFESPTDAVVSPDGRIVVAEPGNHSVRVFYPNGTFAFAFGGYGHGDGKFYEPHQVAVSPDGRIVVGDTGKNRILVFESDGSPALAFGSHGHGAGEIDGLRDVAVAPNGSVVVVDDGSGHGRVQVFSPDGSTVSELRHDDYDRYSGWGSGWYPGRVAVGLDGRIVVAEGSRR